MVISYLFTDDYECYFPKYLLTNGLLTTNYVSNCNPIA